MRNDRHFGGHASSNNGTNCRKSAIYATIGIIGGLILIIAIVTDWVDIGFNFRGKDGLH